MRRKTGITCIITGAVLVFAALLLLRYNQKEDKEASIAAGKILPQIEQAIENQTVSEESDQEMKVVKIDGYDYMGYLFIPALALELPVMSDWSYPQLKIAPCRDYGSVETQDLVIAGHNYKSHFGRLKDLTVGDEVYFTDINNVTSLYTVELTEILQATQGEEMRSGEYDLTLYTCTYGGKTRVTVRCRKEKL